MKKNHLKNNDLLFWSACQTGTLLTKSASLLALLAATIVLVQSNTSHAQITWGGGTITTNNTDILTNGTSVYAYDWANSAQTVNSVSFTGSSSAAGASPNVSITASTGSIGNNGTAFGSIAAGPYTNLSSAYQGILKGGDYANSGNATFTVMVNNLTSGHLYAVQIWVNDDRSGAGTRTEAVSSSGGNTITLAYQFNQATGGVGQYGIGTFTASGTTQTFTMLGAGSTQLNALQVRDVTGTGYTPPGPPPVQLTATWNGGSVVDSNWSDATNWGGFQLNNNMTVSSGLTFGGTTRQININDLTGLAIASLTFSTAGWNISGNALTNSGAITDNVGGTNVWGLNTTLSATPTITQNSGSAVLNFTGVLSGSGGITKASSSSGQGVVNLVNTNNSFTGTVYVPSGTLGFYSLAGVGTNSSLGAGSTITLGYASTAYGGTLNYLGTQNGETARPLTIAGITATEVQTLENNSSNNSGLEFDGTLTIANPLTFGLSGTSTGTNIFTQVFNAGNTVAASVQASGPGTWVFKNGIYATNSLTISTNTHFVSGYDGYGQGEDLFFNTINVSSGGTLDVSSYDANSLTFELGYYYSTYNFIQTLTAGHTNGASGNDIIGSLGLYNAGASLNIGGSGVPATLGITGSFIPGGGTIEYDLGANNTAGSGSNDLINVGGNLDLSQGPATINVSPANGLVQSNLSYTLINYNGSLIGNASGLSIASPSRTLNNGVVSTATPNTVMVSFASSGQPAANLIWVGNVNDNWDVKTTANWLNGASSDLFYNGDNVTFNDSSSQTAVNILSSLSAGLITVSNNVNNYTISTTIAGGINSGSLLKQGTGAVTINTANAYSGGSVVSSGTLIGGNATAFGNGTVTLGDTNTGTNTVIVALNSLTVANPIIISSNAPAGNLILSGNTTGTAIFGGSITMQRDLIFSNGIAGGKIFSTASIAGTGNVRIDGGNVVNQIDWYHVSAASPTTVYFSMSGNIFLTNSAFFNTTGGGLITNTASVIMATNTTFGVCMNPAPYNVQVINALIGYGTVIAEGATWNSILTVGAANGSGTYFGIITNNAGLSVSLIKTGTGTETLTGNSSGSSGSTTVSAGTLAVNNTVGSGLGSGGVFINAGATLAGNGFINVSTNTVTNNGVIYVGNTGDTSGATLSITNTSGTFINAGGALNVNLFIGAGSGNNTGDAAAADILNAQSPVTLASGSVLTVGNPNGLTAWAAGDKWQIATWQSTPAGTFTALNLPALPNGLTWDTSALYSSGILGVIAGSSNPTQPANITSVISSGGNLIITGTNLNGGASFHYEVLSATNLLTPLTNWTVLATNAFNADGTFNYTNPISATNAAVFFDVKAVQ